MATMETENVTGHLPCGVEVNYTTQTIFLIQTSRGSSSYNTIATVTGDLGAAVERYTGVTLRQKGQKKRLVQPKAPTPVLMREER